MTINKKQISKEHAINHPVRFDASPFKLKVEMKVVLRDLKLKKCDIKGEVVSIREGGKSCYIRNDESGHTYLRNCRLLCVNMTLESTTEE